MGIKYLLSHLDDCREIRERKKVLRKGFLVIAKFSILLFLAIAECKNICNLKSSIRSFK